MQREEMKTERRQLSREQRDEEAQRRFEMKQMKKKKRGVDTDARKYSTAVQTESSGGNLYACRNVFPVGRMRRRQRF